MRLLSSLCLIFTLTLPIEADDFAEKTQALSNMLVAEVMQKYDIPGLTMSVVKDGQLVFAKGYGFADLESKIKVDGARSLFRLGSTSKTFTWVAVMQLVEQGKLDLHADVNTYLTQFKLAKIAGRAVTLNDLMAHRGGFEDGGVGYLYARKDQINSLAETLAKHIPVQVRAPGVAVAYSNWGTALAGLIVENVSGMPFSDYIRTHIFTPLAMSNSSFKEPVGGSVDGINMPQHLVENIAKGYVGGKGKHRDFGFQYLHNLAPAGAASSTAADMANYMIALLATGARQQPILQDSTVMQMRTRNFSDRGAMIDFAHGLLTGSRSGYQYFGHVGATRTFKTIMVVFPSIQFGVFVSINQSAGGAQIYEFPNRLVDELFLNLSTPAHSRVETPGSLDKYTGSYFDNRRNFSRTEAFTSLASALTEISVNDNGELIRTKAGISSRWFEISPLTFQNPDSGQVMMFDQNHSGEIVRFTHESGVSSFEKIQFWQSPHFFIGTFWLTCLLAISIFIAIYFNAGPSIAGVNMAVSLATSTMLLLSLSAILMMFNLSPAVDSESFVWPTKTMVLYNTMAILFCMATVLSWLGQWSIWRKSRSSLAFKFHQSFYLICATVLVFCLWQWNMVGFFY